MTSEITPSLPEPGALAAIAMDAARQIPPLWPLEASVAVNPFLGQSTETLAHTGARLRRTGGIRVTMPRQWYADKIAAGAMLDADLAAALEACLHPEKPVDVAALKARLAAPRPTAEAAKTVADLAAAAAGTDYPGLIADRFGAWAAGYHDKGQALWAAQRGTSAWAAWRSYAVNDLTPEISGVTGFASFVNDAPDRALAAMARAVARLGLSAAALPTYFHQLLVSLGGWGQFARYELWQAELAGATSSTITDILAIRLLWEEALFVQHEAAIGTSWSNACALHAQPLAPGADDVVDEVLQEAAERAAQRELNETLTQPGATVAADRISAQAAFCIDVRSEVFRRALETIDPSIQTLGFAGFFGVGAKHRGFGSDTEERRLPVLLNPTVSSTAGGEDPQTEILARYKARAKRAWGRFKLAAVSSFAFVEATGPVYAGKLLRDGLGLAHAASPDAQVPRFAPELELETRVSSAETVLRAMSLTAGFARLVLLVGHGATVTNNPHASSLQCGACGGYSGEVNARLLAQLLTDPQVRAQLVPRGISIPEDTVFVAALHDTTTDRVTLFDGDVSCVAHRIDLKRVRQALAQAGKLARGERALRLPHAADGAAIASRARNWAEIRPEWALAGCKAFIAAPRDRTRGCNLEGRAFLHDYDWHADSANGFTVLELIMTAPVVVASWISLQYYGSTVAPETFGAGNKLLHNVVGGIGVLEGNGGLLRGGLPRQSVHDGARQVHEPLRLSVCIAAPRDAITDILTRHDSVRALFDNRWLHLFALDDAGRLALRYAGELRWEVMDAPGAQVGLTEVA
ncbi:YbcC family protein [Devosia sp.]|uniref:YbcC family protein n=1 Tax=Devosia sp. TaxID=1871048 RepID=UPI003A93B824